MMKTFTDNAGRTWTVTVNVDSIKRVKSLLDVNLLEAIEGKLLEKLVADPVLLCDILYCLCKPQADAQHVADEDFGRAMAGDAIDAATTALLEELADFFPRPKRELLQKALGKLRKLETIALTAAGERLDSPELEERLREMIAGDASGSLPGSPASSPAR
jgi:hypothetical protein